MDNINIAKQGYEAYQSNQQGHKGQQNPGNNQAGGDFGITGGSRFNQPAAGQNNNALFDPSAAAQHASNESGGKDSDLFSMASSFLSKRMQDNDSKDDVDEQAAAQAHQTAYQGETGANMDSKSMGAAAAMQAFKKFTGGGASGQSESGGDFQSKILGMAMKEASSLFDKSGGANDTGDKQTVINSAAETVMKLMVKNQMNGMIGGGNSGGLASMMSKFM